MSATRYVVVCYDVSDNRLRTRLMKFLAQRFEHVQKSVFEGPLAGSQAENLHKNILDRIDPEGDTVRIYTLCARCRPATEILGRGMKVEVDRGDVIV